MPSQIFRCTQADYSANSGGDYSSLKTVEILAGGAIKHWRNPAVAVCKLRKRWGSDNAADRVIVLTDKPQKPLPAAVWAGVGMEAVK